MGSFDFGGGYFGEYDEGGTSGPASQTLTGSSGITSGGAFGSTGVIVGGTATIAGTAGIISGGAFGTNGSVTLGSQILVGSTGISSAGAFGAGGNMVYPQFPTGSVGITSGEAFGVGSLQLALPVPVEDCDLVLEPFTNTTTTVEGVVTSAGTLVATGGGGGSSTTITVAGAPASTEIIHLFWVGEGDSGPTGVNGRPDPSIANPFPDTITDSKGGTWATFTGEGDHLAEISYTFEIANDGGVWTSSPAPLGTWTGGTWRKIQSGSAIRTNGPVLGVGDTITVNWAATQGPATNSTLIVHGFLGVSQVAINQFEGGLGIHDIADYFGNGNTKPDLTTGTNPYDNTLLWGVDEGVSFQPAPIVEAAFVGSFSGYGATSFTPDSVGTVIASHTEGSLFLAVTFQASVPNTALIEPGGTFTGTVPLTVGNYQFMEIVSTVSVTVDDCNLDLEPEVEDCDLVLAPFSPKVIGSTGTGRLLVGEAGIPSAETFGAGAVQTILGGTGQDGLGIAGIPSGETFGTGGIISAGAARLIGAHGISSGGLFGIGGSVNAGNVLILSGGGIVSRETFGLTGKITMTLKGSTGIPSSGTFGSTGILNFTTGIKGSSGIASGGGFGTNGKMIVTIKGSAGIPSPQSGTRFMSLAAGTTQVGGTATAEIDSDGFGTNGSIS